MGIAYFELKDVNNARLYLERSQSYQPSGRTEEYLARIGAVDVDLPNDEEMATGKKFRGA